MHNIISHNQLTEWCRIEQLEEADDKINDYYECLIECEQESSACKRICKEILL